MRSACIGCIQKTLPEDIYSRCIDQSIEFTPRWSVVVLAILLFNMLTTIFSGAIIGQIVVGIICDRIGRKAALVITTALIVLGATLATAAHGAGGSAVGFFWFLTFARYNNPHYSAFNSQLTFMYHRGLTGIVSLGLSSLYMPEIVDCDARVLEENIQHHLQVRRKLQMKRW